jgi:lipoate---protein ligase
VADTIERTSFSHPAGVPGPDYGGAIRTWRILPFTCMSAAAQLACTDALRLEVAAGGPPTLRWYSYDSPALVLGVGQRESDVDAEACREAGVAVVRRASGGSTVLVGPIMLALDVALPAASPLAIADVIESYRWLGEAFRDVLLDFAPTLTHHLVMVDPSAARADQLSQRAAAPDSPNAQRGLACYGTLSPYEVGLLDWETGLTRKLIGFSQVRKRGVTFHQIGLYLRFSGPQMARLLAVPANQKLALGAELDRRIASLADAEIGETRATQLMEELNARAAKALLHVS